MGVAETELTGLVVRAAADHHSAELIETASTHVVSMAAISR